MVSKLHQLPLRSLRVAMLVSGFGLELEGAVSMFWLKILGSPEVVGWLLAGVPTLLCSVWSGKRAVARWSSSCPLPTDLNVEEVVLCGEGPHSQSTFWVPIQG